MLRWQVVRMLSRHGSERGGDKNGADETDERGVRNGVARARRVNARWRAAGEDTKGGRGGRNLVSVADSEDVEVLHNRQINIKLRNNHLLRHPRPSSFRCASLLRSRPSSPHFHTTRSLPLHPPCAQKISLANSANLALRPPPHRRAHHRPPRPSPTRPPLPRPAARLNLDLVRIDVLGRQVRTRRAHTRIHRAPAKPLTPLRPSARVPPRADPPLSHHARQRQEARLRRAPLRLHRHVQAGVPRRLRQCRLAPDAAGPRRAARLGRRDDGQERASRRTRARAPLHRTSARAHGPVSRAPPPSPPLPRRQRSAR